MEYDEHAGPVKKNAKGAIVSVGSGMSTAYALRDCEEKGHLFIGPQVPTYSGMVIGEHVLETDMEMNAAKLKKLTNIRTAGHEE